jgi:hypothetical protein
VVVRQLLLRVAVVLIGGRGLRRRQPVLTRRVGAIRWIGEVRFLVAADRPRVPAMAGVGACGVKRRFAGRLAACGHRKVVIEHTFS